MRTTTITVSAGASAMVKAVTAFWPRTGWGVNDEVTLPQNF
jgi:hypothetical protein